MDGGRTTASSGPSALARGSTKLQPWNGQSPIPLSLDPIHKCQQKGVCDPMGSLDPILTAEGILLLGLGGYTEPSTARALRGARGVRSGIPQAEHVAGYFGVASLDQSPFQRAGG
jgi:hypothetical protein